MKHRIALLVTAVLLVPAVLRAQPESQDVIYTNNGHFRIPYRYDARELQRLGAKEIRLLVSSDYGAHWEQVQSVSVEKGYFEFEAPSDGEYWFAVRTVDAANRLYPEGSQIEPGLKVVVDTTAPTLNLELTQIDPGQVRLVWQAEDSYLDPSSLHLEYIQADMSQWQLMAVPQEASGETSWAVPNGGIVAVRGTVADRAGNQCQAQVQVEVTPAGAAQPAVPPQPSSARRPIASNSSSEGNASGPVPQMSISFVPQPKTETTGPKFSPSSLTSTPPSIPTPTTTPTASSSQQTVVMKPADLTGLPGGRVKASTSALKRKRLSTSQHSVRLVNSRRFQIAYRVDEVGPSGLSKVELFITQDDGKTWWRYGEDKDLQSPIDVVVPADGVYGFAIRVRSGVGLGDPPPRPGEKPTIVIVVDQTPPVLKLLPVQQGEGADYNKVLIRWKMQDDNPADRPIALYYSSSPNGPWEPISGWIADTGSYLWAIQPGVPSRMYIQVAAKDAAGNVSTKVTAQPLVVDLTHPTARIVDVETIPSSLR